MISNQQQLSAGAGEAQTTWNFLLGRLRPPRDRTGLLTVLSSASSSLTRRRAWRGRIRRSPARGGNLKRHPSVDFTYQ